MHKHLQRVYTLTLDLLMLVLLLAAPVLTPQKPQKQDEAHDKGTPAPSAEFKGNAADITANMIERRKQKRLG
jgi:hypothetical protein